MASPGQTIYPREAVHSQTIHQTTRNLESFVLENSAFFMCEFSLKSVDHLRVCSSAEVAYATFATGICGQSLRNILVANRTDGSSSVKTSSSATKDSNCPSSGYGLLEGASRTYLQVWPKCMQDLACFPTRNLSTPYPAPMHPTLIAQIRFTGWSLEYHGIMIGPAASDLFHGCWGGTSSSYQ